MDPQAQAVDYIHAQLQLGQTPDEIAAQLQAAGWPEQNVHQAFQAAQLRFMPTTMHADTPQQPQAPAPQALGNRRGRIRTGWILFKQSMKLLSGNRYLLRYLLMTWVVIIAIEALIIAMIFAFWNPFSYEESRETLSWYVFAFISYVVIYFLINYYAAGLSANILDIFRGKRRPYGAYMAAARAKAGPILVFSIIDASIGMFLRYVVERVRFVGWILSWILGTIWSLSTMFVLPTIMDSDKSAVDSIKHSMHLFKQTWGENITAKVTVNTPLALLNFSLAFLIFTPLVWVAVMAAGEIGFIGVLLFIIFIEVSLAILGSFANSVVNMALYYYATYHQVPPAFSKDMLDHVFIERKHLRK